MSLEAKHNKKYSGNALDQAEAFLRDLNVSPEEELKVNNARDWLLADQKQGEPRQAPKIEVNVFESGVFSKGNLKILSNYFQKIYPPSDNECHKITSSQKIVKDRYKIIEFLADQGYVQAKRLIEKAPVLSIYLFETRAVGIIDQYRREISETGESSEFDSWKDRRLIEGTEFSEKEAEEEQKKAIKKLISEWREEEKESIDNH